MTEAGALEMLRERMLGERSGEVEVTDVRLEHLLDEDDEEHVLLTLILNDPAPGRDTWPVRSVDDLHARTLAEADKLHITSYVTVFARTRDDYDDGGDW